MTKREPLEKVFRISGVTPKDEIVAFDITMHFTADGQMFFIDENLQIVFKEFIRLYGEFFLKINWYSPDLYLVVPTRSQITQNTQEAL